MHVGQTDVAAAKAKGQALVIQAEGCAPVVKAWLEGSPTTTPWENPLTEAPGLRVPSPFAGRQILEALRATEGEAWAVSEREIVDAQKLLARLEGVWAGPGGGSDPRRPAPAP